MYCVQRCPEGYTAKENECTKDKDTKLTTWLAIGISVAVVVAVLAVLVVYFAKKARKITVMYRDAVVLNSSKNDVTFTL